MAQIAKHVFVSAKADGADTARVRPLSNWNDGHVFSGGANGNLLMRDTGDATYGGDWAAGLVWDNTNKLLQITENLAGVAAVDLLYLSKNTTGTPANNMGPGILFRGETVTGGAVDQNMAAVRALWSDVTHATRSAYLSFLTVNSAGALTERVRIAANGDVGIGVTPGVKLDINGITRIRAGNSMYFQNAAADANGTISNSGAAGSSTLNLNSGIVIVTTLVGIGVTPAVLLDIGGVTRIRAGNILNFQNAAADANGTISNSGAAGSSTLNLNSGAVTVTTGVQLGAPTGGNPGSGFMNVAGGLKLNDTAYNNPDYVLEHWATGRIARFADRDGAAEYGGLRSLAEIERLARAYAALPLIEESRRRHGSAFDLFRGGDAVLASVEEAYLHLFDHERRITELTAEITRLGADLAGRP